MPKENRAGVKVSNEDYKYYLANGKFPEGLDHMKAPKKSKYGNKKVEVDGIKFDSKWEAERYGILSLLQKAGEITDLKHQVRIELQGGFSGVDGRVRAIHYIADYSYRTSTQLVYEDAKGMRTSVFNLKWKMLQHKYKDDDQVLLKITFKHGGKKR